MTASATPISRYWANKHPDAFRVAPPSIADLDANLEFQRGYERGLAEAALGHAQVLQDERGVAAERLNTARAEWVRDEGESLARSLLAAIKSTEDAISDAVAQLLRPILSEAAFEETILSLRDALQTLLASKKGLQLEISGSPDLIDRLHSFLPETAPVVVVQGEGSFVRVTGGDTVIETQLAAWMRTIGTIDPHDQQ